MFFNPRQYSLSELLILTRVGQKYIYLSLNTTVLGTLWEVLLSHPFKLLKEGLIPKDEPQGRELEFSMSSYVIVYTWNSSIKKMTHISEDWLFLVVIDSRCQFNTYSVSQHICQPQFCFLDVSTSHWVRLSRTNQLSFANTISYGLSDSVVPMEGP